MFLRSSCNICMLAIRRAVTKRVESIDVAVVVSLSGSAFLLAQASRYPQLAFLSCLALLPLFLVIRYCTPIRAGAYASLWGAAYLLIMTGPGDADFLGSWLPPLALLLCPAAIAYLTRWLIGRVGCSGVLLPLGWVALSVSLSASGVQTEVSIESTSSGSLLGAVATFGGWALVAFLFAVFNTLLLTAVSVFNLIAQPMGEIILPISCHIGRPVYTSGSRPWLLVSGVWNRGPPCQVNPVDIRMSQT